MHIYLYLGPDLGLSAYFKIVLGFSHSDPEIKLILTIPFSTYPLNTPFNLFIKLKYILF